MKVAASAELSAEASALVSEMEKGSTSVQVLAPVMVEAWAGASAPPLVEAKAQASAQMSARSLAAALVDVSDSEPDHCLEVPTDAASGVMLVAIWAQM